MLKEKVSVAVITYNSAETVLETLDSIATQTYGTENIELIISDDASTDKTVQVIDDWLGAHENDFASVLFIKNEINGGISKNYNMAMKTSTCDWIKPIAGDDILIKTCIEMNFDFISKNKAAKVIFSSACLFKSVDRAIIIDRNSPEGAYEEKPYELLCHEQYKWLLTRGNFCLAPTLFINTSTLKQIGYTDERFKFIEDYPLWIKLTKNDIQLYFFQNVTVMYRQYEKRKMLINPIRFKDSYKIHKLLIFPDRGYLFLIQITMSYYLTNLLIKLSQNHRNMSTIVLLKCVQFINPIFRKSICSLIVKKTYPKK